MSKSWKKNDTRSPEYQKKVTFYIVLCLVLGLLGGAALAYKISLAEADASARADKAAVEKVEKSRPIK